jgi:hypothetical protein
MKYQLRPCDEDAFVMNQRFLCCLAVMLSAGSMAALGQSLSPAAKPSPTTARLKTWIPPRTADGQPNLQGTWSNASNTPLERPKELGAKEFYTQQEFAEVSKKGFLGDRGGPQEVHYDFGQFGMDAMQSKFAANLRTSLSAETILYEFTVDDPSTWVKPWTAQLVMGPALGQIYEFACHEGNYGLRNNLSGARAEEKRAAEQAAKSAPK